MKDALPEPFIGAVETAPVILLLLNPGYKASKRELHLKPEFRKAQLANVHHKEGEWPFYFFDAQFDPCKGEYPGVVWWKKRTHELAEIVGTQTLAHRLAVVEWFPYRSSKFGRRCRVPSQDYGVELVNHAIDREELIVIGRGHDCWTASVPRLEKSNYDRVLTLSSTQSAYLTRNNLKWWSKSKGEAWDTLLEALTPVPASHRRQ